MVQPLLSMAGEEDRDSELFELVHAAVHGDLEKVKRFVSKENVDKSCGFYGSSETALGAACQAGHIEIVQFLLNFRADVNVKCGDSTPLHLACDEGHLDLVKTLLAHGADIEDTDCYHRTALHRACDAEHSEIVLALLEGGADVATLDEDKWTPLHISRSGRVAQTLLENCADVNARDGQGFTPVARMSLCDDVDRVSMLLDYGAGAGIICGLQHTKFDRNCTKTVLMCCYSSCHELIFRELLPCFEKYFIKSRLAGIHVNEFEKPIDPPEVSVDWSQSQRDAYAELCLGELHHMKRDTIGNTSATFSSLLTRNLSELRGQRILGSISWGDCHQKYPIYGSMIRCSYQSLRRFFLKDQSLGFFSLAPPGLLPECAEMVLDYLPEEDLEKLACMVVLPPQACNP